MRRPTSPPANVDVLQRTILGLDYRKIVIFALTLPLALGVAAAWRSSPLYLRGAVAVFLALMGVALAFGKIDGLLPEQALLNWLHHLRDKNFKMHRAYRTAYDNRVVEFGPDEEIRERPELQVAFPDFFLLTANAVGVAALTGLTIWLAGGGGRQLLIWWGSQTTIIGA